MAINSDFFQHFGNGTSTGSIGKTSLILPSIKKISDIYLKTRNCYSDFSKSKHHMTRTHEN